MDTKAIRMQAEARGLSPHQAEIAGIVIGLVEGTARLAGAIRAQYAMRQPDWSIELAGDDVVARLEQIIARTANAAHTALSGQIDNLGLSLGKKSAQRLDMMVRNLGGAAPRTLQSIYVDHADLMDMCRTAPARKPGPRPYAPHKPIDITPYWAGMDAADLWPAGVVL